MGLKSEREQELELICAEAYQVVASLAGDLDKLGHPGVQRILDNLEAARRLHFDVLPFPSFEI